MPFNLPIIPLLGSPGGGKSTFCKWLSQPKIATPFGKTLKIHHISFSQIMRDREDEMPPHLRLLLQAGGSLARNDLEMVDWTLELLYEQLEHKLLGGGGGCPDCGLTALTGDRARGQVVIVDGFPRCELAAQRFEAQFGLPLAVIEFQVKEEVAIDRAVKRNRDDRDTVEKVSERISRDRDGIKDIKDVWKRHGELPWMTVDTSDNTVLEDFLPVWDRLMKCVWFQNLWVPSKYRCLAPQQVK